MSRFAREIALIEASGLFDRDWYLAQYPVVAALGMDPIEHYLTLGALLRRDPGPGFDTDHYLGANPDVIEAGLNPLLHYLTDGQREGRAARPHVVGPADTAAAVDVVISVHNAREDVARCLESVGRNDDGLAVRAIVVNDASDAETTAWLRDFCAGDPRLELIEYPAHRGYTRALNAGLRASSAPHVVALNSDTIVTPGWLRGLLRCMASRPLLGMVGPLSNAASWQNVPEVFGPDGGFAVNALPPGMGPDEMARLVAEASRRKYPVIPCLNGFCFMIRREVIETIGEMDEAAFPEGYGEENDYCIRAQDAGFELAVADDVYIFHAKSRSFGHDKRNALSEKGAASLKHKHGARYAALVEQVRDTARLDDVRAEIAARLAEWRRPSGDEPPEAPVDPMSMRILFLLPVRGGGGGVHSIVQEASEMRCLGVDARIAVKSIDLESFTSLYGDVSHVNELFVGYVDHELLAMADGCDVAVATTFDSVSLLEWIVGIHPHVLPAYYVQDYEPLFFEAGSYNWRTARESYQLIPSAMLFAKTHWIANTVRSEHGVHVHKVVPSIDHGVYRPRPKPASFPIRLSAMIRPKTPRRGAERTMRVLSRLAAGFGSDVQIQLFGCEDDERQFAVLERNFDYRSHGVLKRAEVAALLAQSDLFLDLSDYQAFGRTGLEAMACGCAAVLPLSGGADEYAIDGVNALVVDTQDEEMCRERIAALLRAPAQLAKMQVAGLVTASRYSVHTAAISELALFTKQVARHRAHHRATQPSTEKPRICLVPAVIGNKGSARANAGSGYVRLILPYQQPVVARHWQVETCATGDVPSPDASDVVILQRDTPIDADLDQLSVWLDALRRAGGRLIYDLDDDLMDGAALRHRGKKGDVETLARRVQYVAENADVVTVSTPALAERLGAFNSNVRVVPNFVDGRLWKLDRPRTHDEGPFARTDDVVRIGYIGTPTHDHDLAVACDAVQRIEREHGRKVGVEIIGAFEKSPPTFGQRVGLPRDSLYPSFVNWLDQRVHWDIALIPLADDSFNRSKSHLKFLECACLDMAIVCSDVESYAGVARDGENCLVAGNDAQAWHAAIERLIGDPELRARLAAQARRDVIEHYTVAGNAELYLDVLAQAMRADRTVQAVAAAG